MLIIHIVSCPITMEMALLYDGVFLFTETLNNLFSDASETVQDFLPGAMNCTAGVWEKGSSFKNYLGMVRFHLLS